jgi:2-methylisocitrate lyase-like PEP mutase family enzyme
MTARAASLRRLIEADGKFLRIAGVYDALGARIAERAGFDALWLSGFAISAAMLGKPDVGFTTLTEMTDRLRQITDTVALPVVADGEAGFGNALNAMRAVEEFIRAGAAGIQLGDETTETCPYLGMPTKVLSLDDAVLRYRAAAEARGDSGLMIIAAPQLGADRCLDYARAGCDAVFFPWRKLVGGEEIEHHRRLMADLKATGCVPIAVTAPFLPPVSDAELEALGYRVVVRAVESVYAVARVQSELWADYMRTGTTAGFYDRMFTRQADFLPLVQEARYRALAEKYLQSGYEVHSDWRQATKG